MGLEDEQKEVSSNTFEGVTVRECVVTIIGVLSMLLVPLGL